MIFKLRAHPAGDAEGDANNSRIKQNGSHNTRGLLLLDSYPELAPSAWGWRSLFQKPLQAFTVLLGLAVHKCSVSARLRIAQRHAHRRMLSAVQRSANSRRGCRCAVLRIGERMASSRAPLVRLSAEPLRSGRGRLFRAIGEFEQFPGARHGQLDRPVATASVMPSRNARANASRRPAGS